MKLERLDIDPAHASHTDGAAYTRSTYGFAPESSGAIVRPGPQAEVRRP